jgi:hypothetical protein
MAGALHRDDSGSVSMIVVEQSTESRPAANAAGVRGGVGVRRCRRRSDELAIEPLMEPFRQIVIDEVLDQVSQMAFTEDHELIEALGAYRLHEPLRVRSAVRTVRRDWHALDAA